MALSDDERKELERLCAAKTERAERAKADDARIAQEAHTRQEEAARAEAAAIADLHAQAVAVVNIRALIPVVLDLSAPNYTKWRNLFLLAVGKYALSDHVLSDEAFPLVPSWAQMECTVLGWLHNTISSDLSEIVVTANATARRVWLGLEEQFIGNKETRALLSTRSSTTSLRATCLFLIIAAR